MEKKLDIIHKFANAAVIAAGLSHVFCCVLPAVLSILSISTVFGASTTTVLNFEWFEAIEEQVLIFSGVVLFISGLAQLVSWRVKCNASVCCHEPCEKRKNWAMRLFIFATVIYLFNLIVLLFLPEA